MENAAESDLFKVLAETSKALNDEKQTKCNIILFSTIGLNVDVYEFGGPVDVIYDIENEQPYDLLNNCFNVIMTLSRLLCTINVSH